jgi:hypothetical protein
MDEKLMLMYSSKVQDGLKYEIKILNGLLSLFEQHDNLVSSNNIEEAHKILIETTKRYLALLEARNIVVEQMKEKIMEAM